MQLIIEKNALAVKNGDCIFFWKRSGFQMRNGHCTTNQFWRLVDFCKQDLKVLTISTLLPKFTYLSKLENFNEVINSKHEIDYEKLVSPSPNKLHSPFF